MKFIKNILVMSMLLFFIGCTAWPALIPVPPGKKKTTIYPVPLPPTTADVRIADSGLKYITAGTLKIGGNLQLKAIDKSGADISSSITWSSSSTTIATVDKTTGLVTAVAAGEITITATHPTLPAATIKVTVSAAATSLLGFDGKNFIQLNQTTKTNEEK